MDFSNYPPRENGLKNSPFESRELLRLVGNEGKPGNFGNIDTRGSTISPTINIFSEKLLAKAKNNLKYRTIKIPLKRQEFFNLFSMEFLKFEINYS